LLKLVDELPAETFPIQSPDFTGSITGFSRYHAIGFWSELVSGIEMSSGFEKSISKFLLLWRIVAFKNRILIQIYQKQITCNSVGEKLSFFCGGQNVVFDRKQIIRQEFPGLA